MDAILKVLSVLQTELFLMDTNKIWVNILFEKIMEVKGKCLVTVSFFGNAR